jgi:hypothetical protein
LLLRWLLLLLRLLLLRLCMGRARVWWLLRISGLLRLLWLRSNNLLLLLLLLLQGLLLLLRSVCNTCCNNLLVAGSRRLLRRLLRGLLLGLSPWWGSSRVGAVCRIRRTLLLLLRLRLRRRRLLLRILLLLLILLRPLLWQRRWRGRCSRRWQFRSLQYSMLISDGQRVPNTSKEFRWPKMEHRLHRKVEVSKEKVSGKGTDDTARTAPAFAELPPLAL